jgi:hypothetical protein
VGEYPSNRFFQNCPGAEEEEYRKKPTSGILEDE